ncbi:hypothetical protein D9615_001000 [Tricholomella constricta]|uniref:RNA-dependent RNA polymerase n=1 Tax=Tricholomella constricta TaxID=117010 RepID=A0A8H5HL80_9AGAR|nr:hypothetical protein D9615_001000 [Tricholomella constricta]
MGDYDKYFTHLDDDVYRMCDAIESQHNSPTKEFSTLAYSSFSSARLTPPVTPHLSATAKDRNAAASSSSAQWTPFTPSRKRGNNTAGTPAGRWTAIRKSFSEFGIDCDSSDEEAQEVSALLTDSDTSSLDNLFGDTPLSSQGSLSSLGSGWSLPSANTFKVTGSPGKRRIGESKFPSGSSPPKYRRLIERETTPIRKETPCSPVVNDVFSCLSSNSAATASRNDGWNTNIAPSGPALKKFLSGPLGVDLTPSIIAHDVTVQALMDKARLTWGVQYEIARGIARGYWSWTDVQLKVELLRGASRDVAFKVRSIMLNQPLKTPDDTVWRELDREQAAIMENRGRGLGLMGAWRDEPDWYGGQVQQLARLDRFGETYKIHLEPMEKRRSYRLARFIGSRRVLQLRIPDELVKKEVKQVKDYLLQKFILCGRVFVPLTAKENTVYLVETNENYERQPAMWDGDKFRKSFKDIVNWHNALDANADQPISKWSTRFSLAFSTSVPAIEFKEDNIFFIDDLYASDWTGPGKAPAEKIVTDGCGLINEAALKIILHILNLLSRPTAVQGRMLGSKGLWILHPTDKDTEPRIWIRPSQTKINYLRPFQRVHRIFDLVSVSRSSPPISLSKQSIMNLSKNGVPDKVLIDLMVQGLEDQIRPLMEWEGLRAMENLWYVVNQLGGVSRSRLQRLTAGLSRVLGVQRREWGHEDVGMGSGDASMALKEELDTSSYTGRNEFSGAPLAIHELALELIQANFRPEELNLLRDKIRYIISTTIRTTIEKFTIPLQESLGAFVAPDPIGILEEGEVYYRSSQSLTDPTTQTLFNTVIGDGLLGRYPVRIESDIQKVKFVDRPELFNYSDVLIVSTKGNVSFASLLSGGDYDGDDLFIIREKSLVEPFQNKPLAPMPQNFMEDNFERHPERVEQFAHRVAVMSVNEAQRAFQDVLLLSLCETKHGLYSTFHDFSVWLYDYWDPRAIRLSYMFNTLLDSGKTGLRLKPNVFAKDQKDFGGQIPDTQSSRAKPYIFHTIHGAAKAAGDNLLREYDIQAKSLPGMITKERKDEDLLRPYRAALDLVKRVSNTPQGQTLIVELNRIKAVVDEAKQAHQTEKVRLGKARNQASPKKKQKKDFPRETDGMLEASRLFNEDVESIVFFQNVREIKASYAYDLDSNFAFCVAFRDLCAIKARSSPGGLAPVTRAFDEAKSIPSGYVKAMARVHDHF